MNIINSLDKPTITSGGKLTVKNVPSKNYKRKLEVIWHENHLLKPAGCESWPNEESYALIEILDMIIKRIDNIAGCNDEKKAAKTLLNKLKRSLTKNEPDLHTLLNKIKDEIKDLEYIDAKNITKKFVGEYSNICEANKRDLNRIYNSTKHIRGTSMSQDQHMDRLMLFAELNGSKRERYSREYDRILVTKSFRHLQYKTQIMVNSASDDQRTRLLHSLEVQRIARTLAVQLGANVSLAQTIAIGHDVGHAPFGHAGERALSKCLSSGYFGEFSHALQSVKVLNYLENHPLVKRYGFRGLGISVEVLSGILKHDTDTFSKNISKPAYRLQYDCPEIVSYCPEHNPGDDELTMGTLEAQIVYWSDKIAYIGHDWEEFVLSDNIDKLLYDMNVIFEKICEIITLNPDAESEANKNSELGRLVEIRDHIKAINRLFDRKSSKQQKKFLESLNSIMDGLQRIKRETMDCLCSVNCILLSRVEYNLLFDYFEAAQAWMYITNRIPRKYKECPDSIYIIYRYFKDTISQRTTPRFESALIEETRENIINKSPYDIVCTTMVNWNNNRKNESKTNDKESENCKQTSDQLKMDATMQSMQTRLSVENSDMGNDDEEPLNRSDNKKKEKEIFMKSLHVRLDDEMLKRYQIIDAFTFRFYIGSKEVQHMTDKASIIIKTLFEYYLERPEMLPDDCLEEYFTLVDSKNENYRELVKQYLLDEIIRIPSDDAIPNMDRPEEFSKVYNYLDKWKNMHLKLEKEKETKPDINITSMNTVKALHQIIQNMVKTDDQIKKEVYTVRDSRQKTLFESQLAKKNRQLNPSSNHVSKTILARIIADYICGMTDRMAILKYKEITTSSTSWTEHYKV